MLFTRRLVLFSSALALLTGLAQAQGPQINKISAEEYVASGAYERPYVATDSKAQPHFVCDSLGGDNKFSKYHKVNGVWRGGVFAVGSNGGKYNASRLYVGKINIDRLDRPWISCKFGCKEYGKMLGQGVWLFSSVANNSNPSQVFFRHVNVYKGMGAVNIDAKYVNEGVVIGTFGNFNVLDQTGKTLDSGSINAGHGGEKVRSIIASYAPRFPTAKEEKLAYKDGVWHTAMNGSHSVSSSYQNSERYKAGQGYVTWANYGTYPEMGDDYHHPGVGTDLTDPKICYIGQVFKRTMLMNIWDGSKMLFPTSALKFLGADASMEIRHAPGFAPAIGAAGGTFVFWTSGGHIKMCYVSKKGVAGTVRDVSAGRSPAATTDRYGNVHLVYYNNGLCYRKILVSSLSAIEPKGVVADTRSPLFRWTDTKAASYTLELTQDGSKLPVIPVLGGAITWTSATELAVGSYSWRVKESSSSTWSPAADFTIPPLQPEALQPFGRLPTAPTTPEFEWTADDPAANLYSVQLLQDGNLLGKLSVTGDVKGSTTLTATWTNSLGAGAYQWQVKSIRYLAGQTVASDWTDLMGFQVAVPGATAVTNPTSNQAFNTGTASVDFGWNPSDGATSYELKLLFNDTPFDFQGGIPTTTHTLANTYTPGYYTALIRGAVGGVKGPWSDPTSFIVKRKMAPDGNPVSNAAPSVFRWTLSEPATKYLLKLAQYDKTTGKFVVKRSAWVLPPAVGSPKWSPSYIIPDGKFRWSITDYNGANPGYTQFAYFTVKNSGHANWNDPAMIVGTWKVITPWRWVQMTFRSDGVIRTVQGDGTAFTRARWSADPEFLTMVSDVTEKCPYSVTETTLTFTTPSGNVRNLVRVP